MECPSWRELLEVTGYIRLLGLKHTLLGPLFRHTQVCHPEQNMALFLALCLYKKRNLAFLSHCSFVSAAVNEENTPVTRNAEMGTVWVIPWGEH